MTEARAGACAGSGGRVPSSVLQAEDSFLTLQGPRAAHGLGLDYYVRGKMWDRG